jgi:hypothetical protein
MKDLVLHFSYSNIFFPTPVPLRWTWSLERQWRRPERCCGCWCNDVFAWCASQLFYVGRIVRDLWRMCRVAFPALVVLGTSEDVLAWCWCSTAPCFLSCSVFLIFNSTKPSVFVGLNISMWISYYMFTPVTRNSKRKQNWTKEINFWTEPSAGICTHSRERKDILIEHHVSRI